MNLREKGGKRRRACPFPLTAFQSSFQHDEKEGKKASLFLKEKRDEDKQLTQSALLQLNSSCGTLRGYEQTEGGIQAAKPL